MNYFNQGELIDADAEGFGESESFSEREFGDGPVGVDGCLIVGECVVEEAEQ